MKTMFAKMLITYAMLGFAATASANPTSQTPSQVGVNGHPMFKGVYRSLNDEEVFKLLNAKKLNRYRFTIILANDTDPWVKDRLRLLLDLSKKYGVKLVPGIMLPLSWGDKTDFGKYPAGDLNAIYQQGYNRTFDLVSSFGSEITDWELQNETNLLMRDANGSPLWGRGWSADEFNSQTMTEYASLIKGMSDAIEKVNTSRGLKMRRVVGTTSTMFGFLDFMIQKGVKIDVVGYHYYEHLGVDMNNYWGGVKPSFNLFQKLASYGKPVKINEVNCAEIYDANFVNVTGSATMDTCNRNFDSILKTISQQTIANVEEVVAYELFDESDKAGAEGRFGMMYNMASAKPMLDTLAKYAAAQNTGIVTTPDPAPTPVPAPAPTPVPPASGPASMTYPNAAMVKVKNQVTMTALVPTIQNASGDMGCVGILLPTGVSIDAKTCVISGKPNYVASSVPAGGLYVTSTIIAQNKGLISVLTFNILP